MEPGILASLRAVVADILGRHGEAHASTFLQRVSEALREDGIKVPEPLNTPYVNSIPPEQEPPYPGNRDLERRIKSLIRWNAMAMVVQANRKFAGLGGHISTYASCATLYEVGFNHFFRGPDGDRPADQVYFQGHASPGNYARAYLGTDGFGRSDTRAELRRFFKVDAESIVVAALSALHQEGKLAQSSVTEAIEEYGLSTS